MTNPTLPDGNFYFFIRRSGAFGAGHIAWGFETAAELRSYGSGASPTTFTRLYYYGSLENVSSNPVVGNDGENYYWTLLAGSEQEMLTEMASLTTASANFDGDPLTPYDAYKKVPVASADPIAAEALAQNWFNGGYAALFNNCLDNTAKVSDEYGTDLSTWKRHIFQMRPNRFYNRIDATSVSLSL